MIVSLGVSGPWRIVARVFSASAFAGRVGIASKGDRLLEVGNKSSRGTDERTCKSAAGGGECCQREGGRFSDSSRRERIACLEVSEARKWAAQVEEYTET